MGDKLRWGILTTGLIARKFAADLRQTRTGVLAAVGSRRREDAEAFARAFGAARAHGSYDALLADPGVDAVYIGTPHPWHEEWTVRAAAAGKHVLCEKPLALDRAAAARMVAAARAHGVLLMEAFMYRFHPQTRRLRELVAGGAIGELRLIHASFNVLCPFDPEHRMFKRSLGGGAILDLGCYPVSYARHFAAPAGQDCVEPEAFHGAGRLHPVAGTDEFATAVARFPGGILAELSCGSTVVNHHAAQLHGTAGWLDVPNPFTPGLEGRTERIIRHGRDGSTEEIVLPSPGTGLYAYEADAFADTLARGGRAVPLATPEDTLGNMAVLDAWRAAVGVTYA